MYEVVNALTALETPNSSRNMSKKRIDVYSARYNPSYFLGWVWVYDTVEVAWMTRLVELGMVETHADGTPVATAAANVLMR